MTVIKPQKLRGVMAGGTMVPPRMVWEMVTRMSHAKNVTMAARMGAERVISAICFLAVKAHAGGVLAIVLRFHRVIAQATIRIPL